MGNKTSLSVELDKGDVVQAGSALSGRVIVNSRGFLTNGDLYLYLTGKEAVSLPSGRGVRQHVERAERQFFTARVHLCSFTRLRTHGKEFAFHISLPVSLPSSASSPGGGRLGFRITYKVHAQLNKCHEERVLTMQARSLPDTVIPSTMEPFSCTVQGLLGQKGNVTIGARIDDSNVGRGERIGVTLACYNNSTTEIRRVRIKLFEEMIWEANGQRKLVRECLASVKDVDVPGVTKDRRDREEVRRYSGDTESRAIMYQAIHQSLLSSQNRVTLQIPVSSRDTYAGQLVQISHYIEIKVHTSVLSSNPMRSLPVRVGARARSGAVDASPQLNLDSPLTSATSSSGDESAPISPPSEGPLNLDQDTIPIVSAIVLPTAPIETSFGDDEDVIVLGGDALIIEGSSDLSSLLPMPPPPATAASVSLVTLFREMSASVNDYDLIGAHMRTREWRELFRSLSSTEFGDIVAHVAAHFDQVRVASLLVPYVNGGDCFTSVYAAAAVRRASEWNRSSMAQTLIPFCIDIASDFELIQNELNEWDQTVTASDFERAIEANLSCQTRC